MRKFPQFVNVVFFVAVLFSCKTEPDTFSEIVREQVSDSVTADIETTPVAAQTGSDAADDPAIWINYENPEKSLIIGTNKKSGISVYNLDGEELYFSPYGNPNNIDVRYNLTFPDGQVTDIVGFSERTENKVVIMGIQPSDGSLFQLTGGVFQSELPGVYGFCLYFDDSTGIHSAFINDKNGTIEQWEVSPGPNKNISGSLVRKLRVNSQPEGMVADDEMGILYVGEEDRGIWKFHARKNDITTGELLADSDSSNHKITFDIEGLAIYSMKNGTGYLLASSQGNNSYAIFERSGVNRYIGSFSVIAGNNLDGTEETDGIEVSSFSFGTRFPHGLFVAQDGFNFDGDTVKPQNFKLVDWTKISALFKPSLDGNN